MPKVSEASLIASICRESFYDFVREMWDVVVPEALIENWHIQYLCGEMQEIAERVFRNETKTHDLIINISPGESKSTIASIMFPPWTWTRMRTARHICASYAYPLAMDLSRKSRDVIQSEKYQLLFGPMKLREDQNTKGHFANQYGGMRYAVGIGGSVTGMHGHFLTVDDPLDPNQALSEADLKTANNWMSETLPSRKVSKRVSVTTLIMQRLHQDDPTGHILAKKTAKIRHICLPAETDSDIKPAELASHYVDGLMDPQRLPKDVLRETEVELGAFAYSGQYRQNPVPLGGNMFKVERLHIDVSPSIGSFRQLVRYWDKAGTSGGGAYTVGVLMGVEHIHGLPRFWILDVVRGQWDSDARERIIHQTAKLDGKRVIVVVEQEPGSGGKESAEATVRRLSGFRCRMDRPTGDKELRADPFSSQVNAYNVYMVQADWNAAFIEEMRFFPASTYKDQIDAASGAFAQLHKKRPRVGVL